MFRSVLPCLCLVVFVVGETELFSNPNFESIDYSGNWFCKGSCVLEPSVNSYKGQYSVRVFQRTAKWNGVAQYVNLLPGQVYRISAYVNLINTANGEHYQEFNLQLSCKYLQDGVNINKYTRIGIDKHVVPGQWTQVGGAFRLEEGYHTCQVYIQTAAGCEYLADEASAVHLADDPDWRLKANARIEEFRKADINIKLAGPIEAAGISIELKQTKLEFALGSAINAAAENMDEYEAYQAAFLNNFEWAVMENSLKWRQMETNEGAIDYETPLSAMNYVRSNGITTRCHCTFWSNEEKVPEWVKTLSAAELNATITERIEGVVRETNGICEQWDVNNENLHYDFFESHTGDINITMDMFRQIDAVDSHPDLYLNDFGILSSSGKYAMAMKNVAVQYKEANVPLNGIGIQAHLHEFDLGLIKARLDIVGQAGLPIMITELAFNDLNETSKATNLDNILTMMFSLPCVKGINFWGFWDGKMWETEAALYTGTNVQPNAAGLAYENLFHNVWRTNLNVTGSRWHNVRGYKGMYTMTVKDNEQVLATETFTLGDCGNNIEIQFNTTAGAPLSVTKVTGL